MLTLPASASPLRLRGEVRIFKCNPSGRQFRAVSPAPSFRADASSIVAAEKRAQQPTFFAATPATATGHRRRSEDA